jgi:hypothetical protein
MKIPDSFLLKKFYTYSFNPSYKKTEGTYNAGCPVCKEGKSFGKKKRLFFYPKTQSFYCFNCSKSWNAFSWLQEVSNSSYEELKSEILEQDSSNEIIILEKQKNYLKKKTDLPFDSINLSEQSQVFYFKNENKVQKCLSYIKERKLDTAINRCNAFYLSLTDFIHKNRLCIPFYENKKIVFYQTRSLDDSFPKYLSKNGSEKTVFNIDNIDSELDYIFLTEGPIDSMFIKNGVGLAGLTITDYQKKQLAGFTFHKKIWVLDNPNVDETSKEKIKELIANKQNVFMWPLGCRYKDLNEWCIKENLDGIDYNKIVNNLYPINH